VARPVDEDRVVLVPDPLVQADLELP
jgi:hypothetical protein